MASAIIAVAGLVLSGLSGASSKQAAKSARKREVHRIRQQTGEEIRRRTGAFQQEVSAGIAAAGASGFAKGFAGQETASGGYGQMLEGMQKEFALEVDWLQKAAASGIDATGSAYRSTAASIDAATAASAMSSLNMYGASQNWWVKPSTAPTTVSTTAPTTVSTT